MLIDKLNKTTKRSVLIIFVVLIAIVTPIYSFYFVEKSHESLFSLVMYVLGNLLFLYSLSEIIIHIITTTLLTNVSERKLKFRFKSNRMHIYRKSAPFLLILVYLMYILSLYFQMYYLLLPLSLLSSNFSMYILNKYIYAIDYKLIVLNTWGIRNDFNYVSKYHVEGSKVILILNNEEQIEFVTKDSHLISVKELEKYLDS